jgi:pyridoxal phosphate enzyme (YggS family)
MQEYERLREHLARVRCRIERAAERAGRDPQSVQIVAVTKGIDREKVQAAYELGLRLFGENRVQEAQRKFGENPLPPNAELHLIGYLQTNKVRHAVKLFALIHSVDRAALIEELHERAARVGRRLPILIQVNIAGEEQKHGCRPAEAAELLALGLTKPHLDVRGLMTIAPLVPESELVRPVFRALRELRDQLQERFQHPLPELSMGMSNDFDIAVEEGATLVRIGRALFGD